MRFDCQLARGPVKKAQIILLSILAACAYGVIHDQITVRLCLEYFTVAHPPIFHTTSPTLLALCWGVASTVGIGALLGVVLALISQSGDSEAWAVSRLRRSILVLLVVMAASSFSAGIVGYYLSQRGFVSMPAGFAAAIPTDRHDRFMAVWFAHGASYLVGLAGAGLLCFRIWQARGKPSVISLLPQTRGAVIRAAVVAGVAACILWIRFHAV